MSLLEHPVAIVLPEPMVEPEMLFWLWIVGPLLVVFIGLWVRRWRRICGPACLYRRLRQGNLSSRDVLHQLSRWLRASAALSEQKSALVRQIDGLRFQRSPPGVDAVAHLLRQAGRWRP